MTSDSLNNCELYFRFPKVSSESENFELDSNSDSKNNAGFPFGFLRFPFWIPKIALRTLFRIPKNDWIPFWILKKEFSISNLESKKSVRFQKNVPHSKLDSAGKWSYLRLCLYLPCTASASDLNVEWPLTLTYSDKP